MFVRADHLWLEQVEDRLPLHALEFSWDGFRPSLMCRDTVHGDVLEPGLGPDAVGLVVGGRKTCVGQFRDGCHIPCPARTPVTTFSQCDRCASESFIPFQECVFEPMCEGERCDTGFCRREHVLYLAFYDTMVKIGMSSTRRVERRLIEQGADAFSIVGAYPNRKRARDAEKEVSAKLGLPQAIRQQRVLENFSHPLDEAGIVVRYGSLREIMSDMFGLSVEPLRPLRGYPLALPLSKAPLLQDTRGAHRGRFLGLKGKWLIYEASAIRALNMSDLVSRHLAMEG